MSTGIGRTRIGWKQAAKLRLPLPPKDARDTIVANIRAAEDAERKAERLRLETQNSVFTSYHLDSTGSQDVIAAFKPPR